MKGFTTVLLMSVSVATALKCWSVFRGNIYSTTNNATLQDCVLSYACSKSIDFTTGDFSKGCLSNNCSVNGQMIYGQAGPAACYNTNYPRAGDTTTHNQTLCCCYGDGCNPAAQKMVGFGIPAFIMAWYTIF